MAARYWVGGAGNWSSTTKWSTSSGGASGASVPTSADDAIFDANSGGKFTATVDTAQTVGSLTITPSAAVGVMQIAMSNSLTIVGNFTTTGTAGNNRIWFRGTTYSIGWKLSIGGTVSISDVDFRDVYVVGTAAPISGTRLGNHGNTTGITYPAAKSVYWNLAAGGNISSTAWALSAGGAVSTNNHPLAQDTAYIVNTGLNASATVTLDSAIPYLGALDMSGRTTAMTYSSAAGYTMYGSVSHGTGSNPSGTGGMTFANRSGTATYSPNGKTIPYSITVDTWGGGTFALGGNLLFDLGNSGVTFNVNSGTFTTNNFNVTVPRFVSYNSNPRTINAGSSTITGSFDFYAIYMTSTNMTFNAGTSTFVFNASSGNNTQVSDNLFYNLILKGAGIFLHAFNCQNLTLAPTLANGVYQFSFYSSVTVYGTFTITANPAQRVHVQSNANGTRRTFYVGALSVANSGFKDIAFTGPGSGVTLNSSCDFGNNTGVTFAAPKTYYWNLAGSQNWSANGWATSSGGTPSASNFPLSQDTVIFDNAGAAGTVTLDADWYLPNVDMSARTSAMTFVMNSRTVGMWGDIRMGTGVTPTSVGTSLIVANASSTGVNNFLSNGKTFDFALSFGYTTKGYLKLLDAFSTTGTMTFQTGTFDANGMTVGLYAVAAAGSENRYLKIADATINLSGQGTLFDQSTTGNMYIYATVNTTWVSTDNTTNAKYWSPYVGDMLGRLIIGGNTSSSTFSFNATTVLSEIATTKTVPFTIDIAATVIVNKWTATGTVGNPITFTSGGTIRLIGTTTSGLDYLALGSVNFDTSNSTGVFYAGANSTGGVGFTLAAAPAARNLYWVGGTGNWSDTTKWATSSGGAGGNPVPTPFDTVTFDSASSAGTYTVTINTSFIYSSTFTANAPASGTLTLTGNSNHCLYGSATFAATNVTNNAGGNIFICGETGSFTYTPNGTSTGYNWYMHGRQITFTLGGAVNTGGVFQTGSGTFDSGGYNITCYNGFSCYTWYAGAATAGNLRNSSISSTENNYYNPYLVRLQAYVTTPMVSASSANFTIGHYYNGRCDFAFCPINNFTYISGSYNGIDVYNLTQINGTLSFAASSRYLRLYSSYSVGALNITDGGGRWTFNPNGWGVPYSVSVGSVTNLFVTDFNDTTITGAAAPISGTRIGDLGGNSGITFSTKTVYWNRAAGGNWNSVSWALSPGGATSSDNFPMPQDTAVVSDTGLNSGATITINTYLPNVDLTARTLPMTFNWASGNIPVYGSIRSSSSVTQGTANTIYFYGRGAKTLKSAGATWNASFYINNLTGSLTLEDAINTSTNTGVFTLYTGTFDANNQNVSIGSVVSNSNLTRTFKTGTGTWTLKNSGTVWNVTNANLTFTGGATITMTSASAKTFTVSSFMNLGSTTIDQGGAGALTIGSTFTCSKITSSYTATGATSILLGGNYVYLSDFTATGTATNALTITGGNGGFIYSGGGLITAPNYVVWNGIRVFPTTSTWYGGGSSTYNGTLGLIYSNAPYFSTVSETATGSDSISSIVSVIYDSSIIELVTGTDSISVYLVQPASTADTATITDADSTVLTLSTSTTDTATATDADAAAATFISSTTDTATATDEDSVVLTQPASTVETATITDADSAVNTTNPSIADTATGSDTTSAVSTINGSTTDTATVTDSALAGSNFQGSTVETASVSDSGSSTLTLPASLTDTATVTDSDAAAATFVSTVSDTSTGTDAITTTAILNPTLEDTATATDADSAAASFASSTTDTATITDADSSQVSFATQVAETATITDESSALATFLSLLTELATAADQTLVAASTFNADSSETATGTDSSEVAPSIFNADLSEASSAADQVSVTLLLPADILESGTVSDSLSAEAVFSALISELSTGTDTADTVLSAVVSVSETAAVSDLVLGLATFVSSLLESGTVTDALTAAIVLQAALAEQAGITDALSTRVSVGSTILEQATLTDVAKAVAVFVSEFVDTATATDSTTTAILILSALVESATGTDKTIVAASTFNAPVVEIATATGVTTVAPSIFNAPVVEQGQVFSFAGVAPSIFNAPVVETAILFDALEAGFLWNLIDDTSPADWQNINTL